MKRGLFTIQTNQELAPATHRMVLVGDTGAITAPGQFVNIALAGKFLRRPISVCDWDETTLTLIYKVVGQGTAQMAQMVPGGDAGSAHRPGQRLRPDQVRGAAAPHRRRCRGAPPVCPGKALLAPGEAAPSHPGLQHPHGEVFGRGLPRRWACR